MRLSAVACLFATACVKLPGIATDRTVRPPSRGAAHALIPSWPVRRGLRGGRATRPARDGARVAAGRAGMVDGTPGVVPVIGRRGARPGFCCASHGSGPGPVVADTARREGRPIAGPAPISPERFPPKRFGRPRSGAV